MLHLLPNYDEFLIAYKDHTASIDPELVRGVTREDVVFANHLVVVDGIAIGGWRRLPAKRSVAVQPTLLRQLTPRETEALAGATARFSDFLGLPVTLGPVARARGRRATPRAR